MPETVGSFTTSGFSNTFAMPAYQQAVVQTYLSKIGSLNQGLFNKVSFDLMLIYIVIYYISNQQSGRATPDIAAIGDFVPITSGGSTFLVRGTSLSAPIVASIIALINQERLASGKSVLGFLNPMLYTASVSGTFTDIIQGSVYMAFKTCSLSDLEQDLIPDAEQTVFRYASFLTDKNYSFNHLPSKALPGWDAVRLCLSND